MLHTFANETQDVRNWTLSRSPVLNSHLLEPRQNMGKKATTASKAAAKAAKKEKQEKLASRKAAKDDKKKTGAAASAQGSGGKTKGKSGKGGKKGAAAPDEEDLDALLKKFNQDWIEAHAVNEETVGGPPTRRANATLTPCPLGTDLWLFGGEYFDGDK